VSGFVQKYWAPFGALQFDEMTDLTANRQWRDVLLLAAQMCLLGSVTLPADDPNALRPDTSSFDDCL
jgi:hypothetical protein